MMLKGVWSIVVRTQIQLTESQASILQKIAADQGISVAELIRRAVDNYLKYYEGTGRQDLIERAKEAVGKYRTDSSDLAKNHDLYLAEDFEK